MANKIPWYTTLEWKNLTGIIITIASISIIIFFLILPNILQDKRLQKYKGETMGTVTNIIENVEMNQGHGGTNIYIGSYTVEYIYFVNGETYNGTERLNSTPKLIKIFSSFNKGELGKLKVKYDQFNPNSSTILAE